jgi:hypothetical protein
MAGEGTVHRWSGSPLSGIYSRKNDVEGLIEIHEGDILHDRCVQGSRRASAARPAPPVGALLTSRRRSADKVLGLAGQGTFGTVLDVYDQKHQCTVALKVVRSVRRYAEAALIERDILDRIRKADPDRKS